MDAKEIVAAINTEISAYSQHRLVIDSGADLNAAAGTLGGVPVRLQVTSVPGNPSPYRYEVWLFDAGSDHLAGRGNGGPTIPDAISAYKWKDALTQLGLLAA